MLKIRKSSKPSSLLILFLGKFIQNKASIISYQAVITPNFICILEFSFDLQKGFLKIKNNKDLDFWRKKGIGFMYNRIGSILEVERHLHIPF